MSAARRLWAQTVLAMHADTPTGAIAMPEQVRDGCRTRNLDGTRCRHPRDAHRAVGFYVGERQQCYGCACRAWRKPWSDVVQDVGMVALVVFLVALTAIALVAS